MTQADRAIEQEHLDDCGDFRNGPRPSATMSGSWAELRHRLVRVDQRVGVRGAAFVGRAGAAVVTA
jgi:hypothetical protein